MLKNCAQTNSRACGSAPKKIRNKSSMWKAHCEVGILLKTYKDFGLMLLLSYNEVIKKSVLGEQNF